MREKKSKSAQSGEDGATSSLINWMKDGRFSYDFEMTSESGGQKTETAGSMAMDGKNLAVTTETTANGQKIKARVVIRDGAMYVVDDANKFIIELPGSGTAKNTGGLIADYSGITLIGSGVGEIRGKTLPYEEYESDGAKARFYLEGAQVCGMESEYTDFKAVMTISNASGKAPEGAFELPEGYMRM